MYKVAVITMGIRLDDEKGYTRFRSVCEFLADAGYQVDLIMSRDIRKILIYVESIVIELQQRT